MRRWWGAAVGARGDRGGVRAGAGAAGKTGAIQIYVPARRDDADPR